VRAIYKFIARALEKLGMKWKASRSLPGRCSAALGEEAMNDHISGEDLAAYMDGLLSADKKKAHWKAIFARPECLDETC